MTKQTSKKKIDWTLSTDQNPKITDADFKAMVKESEDSPKAPVAELQKKIKQWQKERNLKN